MARSPSVTLWADQLPGLPEVEFGYTPGWDLVTAETSSGQICGRVVCMSPLRAIVVFEGRGPQARFSGQLRFPIDSLLEPIAAEQVGHAWRHASGDLVAEVALDEGSLERERVLLAWLRDCVIRGDAMPPQTGHIELERIRDRGRIERILAMLRHGNANATVRGTGGTGVGEPLRARFDRRHGLLIEWDRARPMAPPLQVSACGYDSLYELIWPDSTSFRGPPVEIVRIRRRRERRVEAPHRAQIQFRHPHAPEQLNVRALVDVSVGGVGFAADTVADGLYPGLSLPVTITWKSGPSFEFEAVVRHCTASAPGRDDTCGVSLTPIDGATAAAWAEQVALLLSPRTALSPSPAEMWDLYRDSGYFRLSDKSNQAFFPLQRAFFSACKRVAKHPEIGAHFGLWSRGRLEATVAQIEAWSGSWLVFQAARTSADRPLAAADDDVIRDLYVHAYEHVQRQAEARYLLAYVQDVARFSRLCHYDFGARRAAEQLGSATVFRAIELSCDSGELTDPLAANGGTVDRATTEERGLCARWIARNHPIHYQRATGLDSPTLELGPIVERWANAGFDRAREVFVARGPAGAEAALITESTDDGLHLFRLLDVARFVPLGRNARNHLPALLDAARRWYAARGKAAFVYFEEQQPQLLPALPGMTDLGLAHVIALPIASLPELLEHVYEVTAPK